MLGNGDGGAKYLLFPPMTFCARDDNPLPLPRGLQGTQGSRRLVCRGFHCEVLEFHRAEGWITVSRSVLLTSMDKEQNDVSGARVLVPGYRENGWDYARSVVGLCEQEMQLPYCVEFRG